MSPAFGFTHQEIIDTVSSEVGNISINPLITIWSNMVITDLASKFVFGNLHMYDSKPTVAGEADLTLADDFYWLKTIGIPTQTRKLYPYDEQRIAEGYPQYRTQQGTISYYYLNSNVAGLWQVPSGIFNVEYSYQRRPAKLVNLDDVPDLPPEWHTIVMQKVMTKAYNQEGNDSGFAKSIQMEATLFRDIKTSAYRRPDEMFVLSGPTASNRPPRPKLPGNFPITGR